ncbi:MAG: hypothetical protein U0586_15465 [Candidatus Brocadiaceae bacterium]
MCALKKHSLEKSEERNNYRPGRQINSWLRRYPDLKIAYQTAFHRFIQLPGVCGLGIGRKFKEKEGCYAPLSNAAGGLCIKVFVRKKRNFDTLTRKERIPQYMVVRVPGKGRVRVLLDVVEVGQPSLSATSTPNWPTADRIDVGRRFGFGRSTVSENRGTFRDGEKIMIGTVGSLLVMDSGRTHWATSAGHVFIDVSNGDYNSPDGDHALGFHEKQWFKISSDSFLPTNIMKNRHITDAMLFKIPGEFVSERILWPHGFNGKIATSEDIDAAIRDENTNGLLWVERNGSAQCLDIDLMVPVDFFSPLVGSGMNYGFVWQYRYMGDEETIEGDSGSPVFINSAKGNGVRLLGFHFMHNLDLHHGYAVDANSFFLRLSYIPGRDFIFKGFENIG